MYKVNPYAYIFIILQIEYCFKMLKNRKDSDTMFNEKKINYTAFTDSLNITGTGNVRDSKWKVYFSRLSEATTTGTATVAMPQLQQNATSIGDYISTVMSPGDSISFEVDVTNDGDYDALLSNVTINGTPTCKYNNDATDTSAQNVCNNLTYTIKYKGGASLIANTDILHSKETQTMVVELKYANITNSTLLPTHDIDITGLDISLTYVQSGNAKVNEDGTTPYDPYPIGKNIEYKGNYYNIIGVSDEYVTLLKAEPLTKLEIDENHYGEGDINKNTVSTQGQAYNINGYGGVAYYSSANCGYVSSSYVFSGCSNEHANQYDYSDVKHVVDDWKNNNFDSSELATDLYEYKSRLAKREELQPIGWPSCLDSLSVCSKKSKKISCTIQGIMFLMSLILHIMLSDWL